MAEIKITGLTTVQANAIALAFERGEFDETLLDVSNKYCIDPIDCMDFSVEYGDHVDPVHEIRID